MLSAPLILLLAVAAAAVAPSAARIVKFAEGSTSIEAVGRVEHVVVRDTKGNVISESRCDSGTFDEYLALFTKLRDAVSRADRSAVVKLVNYPLRVNGKKPLVLQNAASLTKSYEKVFTVTVQEKIRKAEPAAVFLSRRAGDAWRWHHLGDRDGSCYSQSMKLANRALQADDQLPRCARSPARR